MSQLTCKSKFYKFKICFHDEANCLNFVIINCELYAGIVKKTLFISSKQIGNQKLY